MSILSGIKRFKKYLKTDNGYILTSLYTKANSVEFDDNKTAQEKLGGINGITDSLTTESSDIAASAKAVKMLNDSLATSTSGYALAEIGIDNYTTVHASLGLIKLNDHLGNIIINYKIDSNNYDANKFGFIDGNKVKNALNLNSFSFHSAQTAVILHDVASITNNNLTEIKAYGNSEKYGFSGLLVTKGKDNLMSFSRVYTSAGTVGAWRLNIGLYTEGSYGTIMIFGATIS